MSIWSPAVPPPARCFSRSEPWCRTRPWRVSTLEPPNEMRAFGLTLLVVIVGAAIAARIVAPYTEDQQFRALLNAPPTRPHVIDDRGSIHAPFIYLLKVTNQLEQQYAEDRSTLVPLRWFSRGHLVSSSELLIFGVRRDDPRGDRGANDHDE